MPGLTTLVLRKLNPQHSYFHIKCSCGDIIKLVGYGVQWFLMSIISTEHPDVIHLMPNSRYKLQTTRSWDYLGLSSQTPNNLLDKSEMGDGAIIGVLDTGQ